MTDFRSGEIQVLVCTSVVEVGVDVPNATLMTIESPERFGLAQLHQLRGRISRGRFPGFCTVFAETDSEEALARLKAFTATTDGFELAEADFSLRGPGELFGTRQHGLPPFRIADLLRDTAFLEEARRDAKLLVEADPGLARPEHAKLRRQMLARYGQVLELGDVG
jgi:ATP-dependent DNA helicase RecG